MNSTIKNELAKYIIESDILKEVEPITKNHYSLNFRFEVIRESINYYISIKEVDVAGQEKKHHTRLEVDTNLPILKIQNDNTEILAKIDELKVWFLNHKKFKGSNVWISQERKMNILLKKI